MESGGHIIIMCTMFLFVIASIYCVLLVHTCIFFVLALCIMLLVGLLHVYTIGAGCLVYVIE